MKAVPLAQLFFRRNIRNIDVRFQTSHACEWLKLGSPTDDDIIWRIPPIVSDGGFLSPPCDGAFARGVRVRHWIFET